MIQECKPHRTATSLLVLQAPMWAQWQQCLNRLLCLVILLYHLFIAPTHHVLLILSLPSGNEVQGYHLGGREGDTLGGGAEDASGGGGGGALGAGGGDGIQASHLLQAGCGRLYIIFFTFVKPCSTTWFTPSQKDQSPRAFREAGALWKGGPPVNDSAETNFLP